MDAVDTWTGYFFHGKLLPERANIRFEYSDKKAKLSDREVRFSVFSYESEFNGKILSNRKFESGADVHSIVYGLMRSIVDRYCYVNACGYDLDIIGAVSVDGDDQHIFGVSEPVFFERIEEQQKLSEEKIPFVDDLMQLKFHDIRIDHALRCFSHAMRDRALTPLFCYLSIEIVARRVCESLSGANVEKMKSREWEIFRAALNLRRETIESDVKSLADRFRHGDFVDNSWDSRKASLALTWEIIRRGMYFVKSPSALDPTVFTAL